MAASSRRAYAFVEEGEGDEGDLEETIDKLENMFIEKLTEKYKLTDRDMKKVCTRSHTICSTHDHTPK